VIAGQGVETERERRARKERERRAKAREEKGLPPVAASPPVERKPLLPQGRKLSATEANTLSPEFVSSMEDYFEYMDRFLWTREEKAGKPSGQRPVWSDIDDEELAALTRVMMRWGQHNEIVAGAVRGAIELHDYTDVGVVMIPRAMKTVEIIRETRVSKPPRQRKSA